MKNLSIKDVIDFKRKKDEKGKKSLVTKWNSEPKKVDSERDESGGNYWVSCLSAIANAYKLDKLRAIKDKIVDIKEKLEKEKNEIVKKMYLSNINILEGAGELDFKKWKPAAKITPIKKQRKNFVLTIRGVQVQVNPDYVFSFRDGDVEEIGAVWFIAKKKGYDKEELGMFTDALYRYLDENFSEKYTINTKYCVAVDVVNCFDVNYHQFKKREVPKRLTSTLDEIKKMM